MRAIPESMLKDLNERLTWGTTVRTFRNGVWDLSIRYGVRRIEHKARENVLSVVNITIARPLRRQGYLTELLQTIIDDPRLLDQPVSWIYFEQCQYRLANTLVDRLGFKAEIGLVTDAWRPITMQMAML